MIPGWPYSLVVALELGTVTVTEPFTVTIDLAALAQARDA
jgi:hypothetical protein